MNSVSAPSTRANASLFHDFGNVTIDLQAHRRGIERRLHQRHHRADHDGDDNNAGDDPAMLDDDPQILEQIELEIGLRLPDRGNIGADAVRIALGQGCLPRQNQAARMPALVS